jgi:integrase
MKWGRGWIEVEGARGQRRYVGRYRLLDGSKPKVSIGYVSEMTLTEARTKIEAVVRELGSRPHSSLLMTFGEYWQLHYEPRHRPRWSEPTAKGYARYLRAYITPVFGNVRLADFTPEIVSAFFDGFRTVHERSVVNKVWTMLNAVLEDAADDDMIKKNPMRRLDRPKSRIPRKPTLEGGLLRKVLLATKHDPFASALLHVGVFCVPRTSEALGLKWSSFQGSCLVIRDVVSEGKLYEDQVKTKERVIYVSPASRGALKRWRRVSHFTAPGDLIFASSSGTPMSANNIRNRVLEPLREKLGLKVPLTFQVLRRTLATQNQKRVKDIQVHLGHSTPATALGVYAQQIDSSVRQMVDRYERQILSGGS